MRKLPSIMVFILGLFLFIGLAPVSDDLPPGNDIVIEQVDMPVLMETAVDGTDTINYTTFYISEPLSGSYFDQSPVLVPYTYVDKHVLELNGLLITKDTYLAFTYANRNLLNYPKLE